MELLHVAFRNVMRNRRRSLLNIVALSLGMFLMLLGLAWVEGYHRYFFTAVQDFDTGQAQILNKAYRAQERRLPLDLLVSDYARLRGDLLADPEVAEVAGRVDFSAKISAGGKSLVTQFRGIDPGPESKITVIKRQIVAGEYLDGPGVLLGRSLAAKLGLEPGDTVFVAARDRYGSENLTDLRVRGVFSFGYPTIDDAVVFMDLSSASSLLSLDDSVTRVVLGLEPGVEPRSYVARHAPDWESGPDELLDWRSFAATTVSAVAADSTSFYFFLVILFILVFLGMLNSMSMSVHERTAEFGTLRAIGMRRGVLRKMILLECLILAALAAFVAACLSLPALIWLEGSGVDFASMMPGDIAIPFGTRFYARLLPWHVLFSVVVGAASAFAGGLLPARRAARLGIAEALGGMAF